MKMNQTFIAIALLVVISLLTALIGVLKRDAMLKLGGMDAVKANIFNAKFWIGVIFNPYIICIFALCLLGFFLSMVVFSFMTADKVYVIGYALLIPGFLLTIFLDKVMFNEIIPASKYSYLILLIISIALAAYGTWGYMKS